MMARAALSPDLLARKGHARSSGDSAFVIRLDPGRQLRLRQAGAWSGRPVEEIANDAIDNYLEQMLSGETSR